MCELKLRKNDGAEITFLFEDYSEMSNFMYVALAASAKGIEAIVSFPLDIPEKG